MQIIPMDDIEDDSERPQNRSRQENQTQPAAGYPFPSLLIRRRLQPLLLIQLQQCIDQRIKIPLNNLVQIEKFSRLRRR